MRIHVPTYGRAGKQKTLELMEKLGFDVVLWVRPEEFDAYFASRVGRIGVRKIDKGIKTLCETRQYMLDHVKDEFWCMMDDDIGGFGFKPHVEELGGGLRPATRKEILRVFNHMEKEAAKSELFAGSITERFTVARPYKKPYMDYGFMRQCIFISRAVARQVRFDRVNIMHDIDYSLQVARLGDVRMQISRTLCVNHSGYAFDEKRGGLGGERGRLLAECDGDMVEYLRRAWGRLMDLHPDIITERGEKHHVAWKKAKR